MLEMLGCLLISGTIICSREPWRYLPPGPERDTACEIGYGRVARQPHDPDRPHTRRQLIITLEEKIPGVPGLPHCSPEALYPFMPEPADAK